MKKASRGLPGYWYRRLACSMLLRGSSSPANISRYTITCRVSFIANLVFLCTSGVSHILKNYGRDCFEPRTLRKC